ncbi:MAG: hypothetical protein ACYTG1_00945 [Planctomycetota bacterium]|jgi:hypothetical protein
MITQMMRQQIGNVLGSPHSRDVFLERLRQIAASQGQPLTDDAADRLAKLAEGCVTSSVDLLEACAVAGRQAGVAPFVEPILEAAARYFLEPQDFIPDHAGLYGLLDDAYLARRLMAEISELYRQHTGMPLLPVDLGADNLVIRSIIGEPLASTLDQTVAQTIQGAIVQHNLAQLYGHGATLDLGGQSPTGGPGSWGGSFEDEITRVGAECGISINW